MRCRDMVDVALEDSKLDDANGIAAKVEISIERGEFNAPSGTL